MHIQTAKSITFVRGHPKMSTFSQVYKQYFLRPPFLPPTKGTDKHFWVPIQESLAAQHLLFNNKN